MRTPFTGCGTALVTPFDSSGALDEKAIRRLARRQIEPGHPLPRALRHHRGDARRSRPTRDGGWSSSSSRRPAGEVPVLAGAGGYDTAEVVEAARAMHAAGAQGLLSVTPYYNKPTPEGLFQHYSAIADATPLPIVVYNVPGRTGCNVTPETLVRLASIPNVAAVKEASGNINQISEVCRTVPEGFIVLSGDDAMTLPAMAVGAQGLISVASNEAPGGDGPAGRGRGERGDFADARASATSASSPS